MTEWLSTVGGKCVARGARGHFLRSWTTSMAIMCPHILGTGQKKPKIFYWGNRVYKQFLITMQKMTCIAIAMAWAEYLTKLSWRKSQIEFYNTGEFLTFFFSKSLLQGSLVINRENLKNSGSKNIRTVIFSFSSQSVEFQNKIFLQEDKHWMTEFCRSRDPLCQRVWRNNQVLNMKRHHAGGVSQWRSFVLVTDIYIASPELFPRF